MVDLEIRYIWDAHYKVSRIPNPEFRIFTNSFIDQGVQNLLSHMTFIHWYFFAHFMHTLVIVKALERLLGWI